MPASPPPPGRPPLAALGFAVLVGLAGVVALRTDAASSATPAADESPLVYTCSSSSTCERFINSGTGAGVGGKSTSGVAAFGISTSNTGVNGQSDSGSGVVGSSHSQYGVVGRSTSAPGVIGQSTTAIGVAGETMAEGTAAKPIPGVVGQANNNAAQAVNYGVEGLINHGGEAVAGFSMNANGGLGDGVLASSDPSPAPSLANDAVALFAQSTNGTAVYGISDTTSAGYFVNGSTGTDVTVEIKAEGEEFMLNAENTVDGGHVVIDDHGNLILNGHVMTDAASHIAHRARDGQTIDTYAAESSEANVEDDGTATLMNGEARVPLEPRFADSIDTSHRYMVFLTPAGDCRGLFVAQRSAAGFVVRELQGGRSTLSFDYRIVARPADATSAARLPASSAAAEFARAESRVRPYSKALNVSHRVQAQNAATSAMGIATH